MGYRIEYKGRHQFIQKSIDSGIARITAENYARRLVRGGEVSEIAQRKWKKVMDIDLPDRYYWADCFTGKRRNNEYYIPDYLLDEVEDITPPSIPTPDTTQEFHGQDHVEEAIEEERKDQVALLLDIMKDVMESNISSESKLEVVRIFVSRMETIEWAM